MATAREKPSPTPRPKSDRPAGRKSAEPLAPAKESPAGEPLWLRASDAVYRFLASLKLAVLLIATLAGTLAYATFYETMHGTGAVQDDIYRSKGFALLMAMLGVNILCAALIRFPWKKRQTGFVVTHAGLLIVLAGSFLSIKTTEEGQIGIIEGQTGQSYARTDDQVIRLRKVDPQTGASLSEYAMPIRPGAFPWEADRRAAEELNPGVRQARIATRAAAGFVALGIAAALILLARGRRRFYDRPLGAIAGAVMALLGSGLAWYAISGDGRPRSEILSDPSDPFQLAMTDFLPASSPMQREFVPGPDGLPMVRVSLLTQPPGAPRANDALGGDGWIATTDPTLGRGSLNAGPAVIDFLALEGPHAAEALDAFLHPPEDVNQPTARFYYQGRDGQARVHVWPVNEEAEGQSFVLPDSDLKVTYFKTTTFPTEGNGLRQLFDPERPLFDISFGRLLMRIGQATGQPEVTAALFNVKQGDGPVVQHIGWGGVPMAPVSPVLVSGEDPKQSLLWVDLYEPPGLTRGPGMSGTFGAIQVAKAPDGRFFYRAFGRDGLKGIGSLKRGEIQKIFGGDKMPMQVSFRLDESIDSGVVKLVSRLIEVEPNQMDKATPAARLALKVDGHSTTFWLRRTRSFEPDYRPIDLPAEHGAWEASFDFDTRPLPFKLNLIDFNPTNDPGASARASYRSDVLTQEPEAKLPQTRPFSELAIGDHFYFLDRPREAYRKSGPDTYRPFDDSALAARVEDASATVQPTPEPNKIYMNHPMVRENWSVYQASFSNDKLPPGQYMSIFAVRYDVAWPVIYVGCLLIVLGAFFQFYMRAGIFTDGGKREQRLAARKVAADEAPGFEL